MSKKQHAQRHCSICSKPICKTNGTGTCGACKHVSRVDPTPEEIEACLVIIRQERLAGKKQTHVIAQSTPYYPKVYRRPRY